MLAGVPCGPAATLFLLAASAAFATPANQRAGANDSEAGYEPTRLFAELPLDRPLAMRPYEKGFLVLDRSNHRLLHIDAAGKVLRQIGRLGQADDDLRFPRDFAVDGRGRIFVITGTSPFGIKVFDPEGRSLGVILQGQSREDTQFYSSQTVVVSQDGEIYLSQPRQKALITRYNIQGKRLGNVGELFKPDEVFGNDCQSQPICRDRRFAVSLSRVQLALTLDGSIVVASSVAPIVRQYGRDGSLVFETRLRSETIDRLQELLWLTPESWRRYYSFNADGVQVLQTITGLSVDPTSGRIFALVGASDIIVLSPQGEQITTLKQDATEPRRLERLVVHDGIAYLNDWRYLYSAALPEL